MEFEGIVYKILPKQHGTGARGEWTKMSIIFEMPSEFSRKVCVSFFGDKTSYAESLREGDRALVSINIESREYNGRWYTDIRAWRVQPKQQQPPVPMTDAPLPSDIPAEGGSFGGGAAAEVDDLPF